MAEKAIAGWQRSGQKRLTAEAQRTLRKTEKLKILLQNFGWSPACLQSSLAVMRSNWRCLLTGITFIHWCKWNGWHLPEAE